MKTYLTKVASVAAGAGLFLVACLMASLGLSLMVLLSMFALAVIGLGILAAPLVALVQSSDADDTETVAA